MIFSAQQHMLSPVRLLHGWISQNYFEFSKPEASICIPQPKSNYVHFALNIWHLVATILMIFLRINCPNLGQFDWIIKVFRDLQYRYANAMLPLSLRKVWKVSKLTRPEIHQFIKTVQKNGCNRWSPLYGGPRKVLDAFETLWHVAA